MPTAKVRVAGVVLLAVGAYLCVIPGVLAQTADSQSIEDANKSWTATTDFTPKDMNPLRVIESHSQNGNLTVDKRSDQIPGYTGHFEPFRDSETETLQVDANTVRITTRTFARDLNRTKTLVDVTEEEKYTAPDGNSKTLRLISSCDVNGRLQPVRRETGESKRIGIDTEETSTTIMLASINGGLAPAIKVRELRKRPTTDMVETERTTWFMDANRNWQVREVRHTFTRQEGESYTTEERISRPDAAGKLGEVSYVVSHESGTTNGERHAVVETYSTDVPGAAPDGSLHLVERKTSVVRANSTGEQTTTQTVEQIKPGNPSSGLRVSVLVDGKVVPGPSGEQSTVTIRTRDLSGNFPVVSVEMTKSDRIPTLQVQQTRAERR
jgi:hypothetical protein